MAYTVLTAQTISAQTLSETADSRDLAENTPEVSPDYNYTAFPASGSLIIIARNTDATAKTVTVWSKPDRANRNGTSVYSIDAAESAILGPFPSEAYNNTTYGLTYQAESDLVLLSPIALP